LSVEKEAVGSAEGAEGSSEDILALHGRMRKERREVGNRVQKAPPAYLVAAPRKKDTA
jgi:hypothetical protein